MATLPTSTVGAVAGAVEQVGKDAQPVIQQAVDQSYEVAFKERIARAQAAIQGLVARPGDPAAIRAFDALLTELCDAAGYVRTGGVQPLVNFAVSDLAIFLEVLCREILGDEKQAVTALAK